MKETGELPDALRRLDQAWREEQVRYQMTFKDSDPKLPSAIWVAVSLFGGILTTGAGWLCLRATKQLDVWDFNPMFGYVMVGFGILFIMIGVWIPIFCMVMFVRYKSAYRHYQRRRAEVIDQLGGEAKPDLPK